MLLKDGATGQVAKINMAGMLATTSVTQPLETSAAINDGASFIATTGITAVSEPNSTTKTVLAIKNTSPNKLMLIDTVRVYALFPTTSLPAVGEYFTSYLGGTDITGGTSVVPTNTNATSNSTGEQTILIDGPSVTGTRHLIGKYNPANNTNFSFHAEGVFVLGQNNIYSVDFTSATANTDGELFAYALYTFVDPDAI